MPTIMAYTRQKTKNLHADGRKALKGAYIVRDSEKVDVIIIATGSEVGIAYDAYDILKNMGIGARVVSMPCTELFEEQSEEYKESVLPSSIDRRIAVEASSDVSWYRYVGIKGKVVGMTEFGKSAPYSKLFDYYGFTAQHVAEVAARVAK